MATQVMRSREALIDALRRLARRGAGASIVKFLAKVRPGDVAEVMQSLTPAERAKVFAILVERFPDSAGDVLADLEPSMQAQLVEGMSPEAIGGILEVAPVDDAVAVIDTLPSDLKEQVLEEVDRRDLDEVQSHLGYADDSAGRMMTSDFFALPETATVKEAVASIQGLSEVEMIFYLYVVDEHGRLVGVTSLRQLIVSSPERTLGEIAQRDVIQVTSDTDQEEVAELAARYDLLAIPVVDDDGSLAGIITVDDIVDILMEEATEDFYKLAGTSEDELVHQERSLKVARIRLPWLLFNLVGLFLTGLLLERFQVSFGEAVFLLAFVPVIMGMGGNSGTQTSTVTVRGLATGRLALGSGQLRSFLWKQVKVGIIIGLATGLLVAAAAFVKRANPAYALVVGVSLFLAIVFASFSGASIPILFERLGVDPAVAASPLVTTSNDITGILIYFGMATLLIDALLR